MTTDDAAQELPQQPLPRFSIRWLLGLITVAALFFTVCQIAASGNRWAQVIVLLVGITVATLIAYAAFFLIGMAWDTALVRREVTVPSTRKKDKPPGPDKPARPTESSETITIAAWIVAFFFIVSGSSSAADVIWLGTYPGGANALDYRLQVGIEEQSGPGGYLNLHLKFLPTRGAFTAAHDVTVSVSSHHNYKAQLAATTSESFALNESTGAVTHHMLIPNFDAATLLTVWITENGKEVFRNRSTLHVSGNALSYTGQRWTIGVIDGAPVTNQKSGVPAFPDLRSVATIFGNDTSTMAPIPEDADKPRLSDKESRIFAAQTQPSFVQFRVITAADLAHRWLAYSDLDLIMVDMSMWSDWTVDQPMVLDALKKFAAAGGVLLLYGDDSAIEFAKASIQSQPSEDRQNKTTQAFTFEKLSSTSVPNPSNVVTQLTLGGENDTSPLTQRMYNGTFAKESQQYGNRQFLGRQPVYDDLVKAGSEMIQTQSPDKLASQIEMATYGLGKVVLIDDEDPFPGSFQLWMTLEAACLETPLATPWIERHGVQYEAGNTNYWRWLIESVGGPPVKSFLTLNSVFVLIVGPIAYFALRRFDRLYLLYFGAPALAIIFTGGLFGFAVFSDGIGTKLRTHQWTWVDAANQVVVYQDRSTVYSSFGTDSLRFDRNALVLPVLPTGMTDYSRYSGTGVPPNGRVRWTDDAQFWSGEFLPTRAQVQYQVTRPDIGVPSPLIFEMNADKAQMLVLNNLEHAIGPLVYCDAQSAFYVVDRVAAGQSMIMRPSSQQDVRDLITDRELPPVGIIPNVQSSSSMVYNRSSPGDERPLPERLVQTWTGRLPKNSFIGLCEVDQSRFPVKDPQVSIATHIIMGTTR